MLTHIDVSPRIDGGSINSSPVSAVIPVEKFYKGCDYKLRIPGKNVARGNLKDGWKCLIP